MERYYHTCKSNLNSKHNIFVLAERIYKKLKAPKIKTIVKPGCILCRGKRCMDEYTSVVLCSRIITRSISKSTKDFIIIENYRCMPLLGDEQEKVPDWDVHIVRYSIVFINSSNSSPDQSFRN